MDLLQLAEEYYLVSFAIVLSIGLFQGGILARGIRHKFPSFKRHASLASVILLILFSLNAAANVFKFAIPEKLSISELTIPSTAEEGFAFVINVLGLNAGFAMVTAMFISITLILLLRFADLSRPIRYFIFTISAIMFLIAGIGKFTDYVPTLFQIIMYVFYQFGFTVGIFLVTRIKEKNHLAEFE